MKIVFLVVFCFLAIAGYSNDLEKKVFAGIEVGTKGIRWAVIEILNNKKSSDSYHIIKDSSIITNFILFKADNYKATVEAVKTFVNISRGRFKITNEDIYIGVSSGVQNASDKEQKQTLIDNLKAQSTHAVEIAPTHFNVQTIPEESEDAFVSIIPELAKKESLYLDFGSGNVKGGYFISNSFNELEFRSLFLNWGGMSILKTIIPDSKTKIRKKLFFKRLNKTIKQIREKDLPQFLTSSAGVTEKLNIILGGGVSWVTNNFLMPNQSKFEFLKVNTTSLNKLRIILKDQYKKKTLKPELFTNELTDSAQKAVAHKKIEDIMKIYDIKTLICSIEYLYAFVDAIEKHQVKPNIFVTQLGSSGWLPGFVQKHVF